MRPAHWPTQEELMTQMMSSTFPKEVTMIAVTPQEDGVWQEELRVGRFSAPNTRPEIIKVEKGRRFRKALDGEKHDCSFYSPQDFVPIGLVEIE
jgi:hypothetical protein